MWRGSVSMDGIHQTRNMQNTAAAMKRGSASAPDAGSADSDEPRSAQATGSAASEGTVLSVASKADSESMPPRKKMRMTRDEQVERIAGAVGTILECLDDDPSREGLLKTPERYAKALLALTEGYSRSANEVLGEAQFDERHSEAVLMRGISVFSLCEHHLLPFHGYCHIAYIPRGTVVGLSKLARIVDVYAKRLQVQERLTTQIADSVASATDAAGVMVYVTCTHMCMSMRGVQKTGTTTITTAARGLYAKDSSLRDEFLSIIRTPVT